MHKVKRFFLLFFAILVFPCCIFGAEINDSIRIIRDLKRSLLVYDASQESFVPHAFNTPVKGNAVSVMLNMKESSEGMLYICGQPNTALFIEQKIVASQAAEACIMLNIDSLYAIYGDTEKESLFITAYHNNLDINELQFSIVKKLSENEMAQLENSSGIDAISRSVSSFKDFYIIGLLIILSLIAMIKAAYPKIFQEFYSISKIFSFKWREDSLIASRAINTINLVFLVVYSLVFAFIVVVLWHETDSTPEQLNFIGFSNFYSSFFSWISITFFVFIIIILKYLVIYISSSLLGFKDLISFHFLDFIRVSQLFMFLILAAISLSMISFYDFINPGSDAFSYIVFFCILLTTALLFFKLLSSTTYRNMHLFSYLCTTEILPLIISIKFFLNL